MGSTKYNINTKLLTIAILGFFFGFLYSQQQVSAYSETDNHNQYIAPAPGGNLQATTKIVTTEVRDLGNTVRVDPLNNFKKYRGGFDIKNKHYWSSTLFTGIYGYAIAVFGLLLGLVYGVTLLSTALCCKTRKTVGIKKRQFYCSSRYCSLWPVFLGTALTVLAIAASGVVLGGSSKFHSKAKTIMHIIVDTADGASDTLHNVTGAMRSIPDNLGTNQNKTGTFVFPNSTTAIYLSTIQVNIKISALRPLFSTDLKLVCNPFTAPPEYNYQPANCPANTIQIADIPQVVKIFSCSNGDSCKKGNFVSASEVGKVEAYTSSIQNLLDAFPGMESLADCQVVKDAFTEIITKHCKPVKKSAKMVWSALVVLSSLMVVLVSIWTITAFHDSKHHFAQGSIRPQLAGTKSEEFELPNARINKSEYQLEP